MSGANLSLEDWVLKDDENDYYLFLPHVSKDFDYLSKKKNIHIISGGYFALCKDLEKKSFAYRLKKSAKKIYMALFYATFIKKRLLRVVSKIKPDAILSNSFAIWIGADIAKTLGIPHIWHVREFMELDHRIAHYNFLNIEELANYSSAIFISRAIANYYSKKYHFKNSAVIYDSIKYQANSYDKQVKKFINKPVKAIFVGTISRGKGVLDAVKAVEELNEQGFQLSLDIFGEGPQNEEVKNYILSHKDKMIRFLGFSKDLISQRRNYDLEFVCSKMEALGRVTVEGMYYGNLVIGANSGGTTELIKNGKTGVLYESGNIDSLIKASKKVLENVEANNEMIHEAHDWAVRNFSNPITNQLIQFIKISIKE
ncbi:glycosyltransferase family 4 protein [Lactobacillus delbrueckii]|uniref:glycosyltransferase family 4 protein n=1 Tax=Lactobacillus delbrueckii TaxID=1584 RepID=UPI0039C4997A